MKETNAKLAKILGVPKDRMGIDENALRKQILSRNEKLFSELLYEKYGFRTTK